MFAKRVRATKKQTSPVTEAASSANIPIPGLSVYLPRAGAYFVRVDARALSDAVSKTVSLGVIFSATADQVAGSLRTGTGIGTILQADNVTLAGRAGITADVPHAEYVGRVHVTGPGFLVAHFARSAGSITVQQSSLEVLEEGI